MISPRFCKALNSGDSRVIAIAVLHKLIEQNGGNAINVKNAVTLTRKLCGAYELNRVVMKAVYAALRKAARALGIAPIAPHVWKKQDLERMLKWLITDYLKA